MIEAHVRDDVEIIIFTDRTSMWHKPMTSSFITKLEEIPDGVHTRKERMRNIQFFELHRSFDVSGTSGEGVVAEGAMFSDGTCALRWLTKWPTTCPYDSPDHIVEIHGHGEHTKLRWLKSDGTYEERP